MANMTFSEQVAEDTLRQEEEIRKMELNPNHWRDLFKRTW